jgi:hypothetical protein
MKTTNQKCKAKSMSGKGTKHGPTKKLQECIGRSCISQLSQEADRQLLEESRIEKGMTNKRRV